MKWSRWYMYVIPGGIVGMLGIIGIVIALSFMFPEMAGTTNTPDFSP